MKIILCASAFNLQQKVTNWSGKHNLWF